MLMCSGIYDLNVARSKLVMILKKAMFLSIEDMFRHRCLSLSITMSLF